MQFCNQIDLEDGTTEEILQTFVGGVMDYLDEPERFEVQRQLDAFLHDQEDFQQQADYYAHEKLAFEKELALSLLNGKARPSVQGLFSTVWSQLKPEDRMLLSQRQIDDELQMDDYVLDLAIRLKTVTIDNRAGLATLNERTVKRVAAQTGLEQALSMAQRELALQQIGADNEFMIRRNEELIAESGVGCGGGCSVSVVDMFSEEAQTAKDAGLKGTLYEASSLNEGSKCNCGKKAKVISDGKNVVCVSCKEFQVNGKKGKLN